MTDDTTGGKRDEYVRYAEHCLRITATIPDRDWRMLQREMAAEWLRLAETER